MQANKIMLSTILAKLFFFPHKPYLSGFKVWFPKPVAPDLKICEKWSYSQDPMRNADSQTHFRPSESEIEGGSQWSVL